ncbi:uncharacterized protein LOC131245126 [Magnolia sinica]|uniref:uncharacterized protein LOC131245126 n=1 Tax=Magnolia sinica TaxID=86752 RepID=UPI0026592E26|nr:uncharacterized protein LOC131245126 [Magnolia sinica]
MARIAVTICVIFSIFLLAHARNPSNLPERSVSQTFPISVVTEDDAETLTLPTEKPESDAIPAEKSESDTLPMEKPESDTVSVSSISLPTMASFDVRFRTINRHFPHPHGKRPFLFRFPHRHRCLHHPHIRGPHVRIPYGNDMILAQGFGGGVRQIPAGVARFPGVGADYRRPRHMHVKEEEDRNEKGGFVKWFREIANRF